MMPTSDTKGRVLPRLRPAELNTRLAEKIGSPTNTTKTLFNTSRDLTNHHYYFHNGHIIFSTATDTPNTVPYLPTFEEIINTIETNEKIKEHVRQQGSARIYIPIASIYYWPSLGPLKIPHAHFRGVYLNLSLDSKNKIKIDRACLIDSRNKFFGRFAPYTAIQNAMSTLSGSLERIFTGHQSVFKGDNDSCGYRSASYGIQALNGTEPKKLVDDVKCSTKFLEFLKHPFRTIASWFRKSPAIETPSTNKAQPKTKISSFESISSMLGSTTQTKEQLPPKNTGQTISDESDWDVIDEDESTPKPPPNKL